MATAWTPTKNPFVSSSGGQYAVLSDGAQTVWAAYLDNSDGNLKIIKSVDEGQNYGSPVTIMVAGGGLNAIPLDTPLAYDPIQRRLHLIYGKNFHVVTSAAGTFHRYSDDQGATWSAEQTIDDGSTYDNTNGRFTRVGTTAFNGFYNIVYSTENSVSFRTELIALYRSTDGGLTFAAKTTPWSASALGSGNAQTRPVSIYDKQYIHVTWSDAGANSPGAGTVTTGGDVFYSRSADQGVTWTTTNIVPSANMATTNGAGRPTLWSSGGVANLCFMSPFGNGINSNVWVMHTYDGGTTWGAPQKLATNNGSAGLSHPILTGKNGYFYVTWANQGTLKLQNMSSTDGGLTWSAISDLYTYVASASDAPWAVVTNGLVHIWFTESTGGIGQLYIRNPYFWQTPDTTRVLFNPVGAGSTGPPPTGFTGSNGWCQGVGSAGDGLVTVSNTLTKNSAGGFRQGSWRTSLLASQDHEAGVKFATAVSTWDANGGLTIYLRMQSPGTSTPAGYLVEFFNGGTPFLLAPGEFSPTLATGTLPTILANDFMFVQMVGTSLRCWYLPTGSTTWQLMMNAVDSTTKANGNVGLDATSTQASAVSSFLGGTVVDPTIPQGSQRRSGATQPLTGSPARWR